jgi:hypothetical protein
VNRPHPSTSPGPEGHLQWAAWWGQEAVTSLRNVEARPHDRLTSFDEAHAIQAARLAWWHVCRAKGYPYWDILKRDALCR